MKEIHIDTNEPVKIFHRGRPVAIGYLKYFNFEQFVPHGDAYPRDESQRKLLEFGDVVITIKVTERIVEDAK